MFLMYNLLLSFLSLLPFSAATFTSSLSTSPANSHKPADLLLYMVIPRDRTDGWAQLFAEYPPRGSGIGYSYTVSRAHRGALTTHVTVRSDLKHVSETITRIPVGHIASSRVLELLQVRTKTGRIGDEQVPQHLIKAEEEYPPQRGRGKVSSRDRCIRFMEQVLRRLANKRALQLNAGAFAGRKGDGLSGEEWGAVLGIKRLREDKSGEISESRIKIEPRD